MITIGIIGAQGKFGSRLSAKLHGLGKEVNLLKTKDRLHNREIAEQSDIVILTVPPNETINAAREIMGRLKSDSELVSFAAGISLNPLQTHGYNIKLTRAMTDPGTTIGMLLKQNDTVSLFEKFFSSILKYPLQYADTDQDVNGFTVGISYLFTSLLWAFQEHPKSARNWAKPYIDHTRIELNLNEEIIEDILKQVEKEGNFKAKLQEKATKGGITAALLDELRRSPDVDASTLYEVGMERMNQIVNQLSQQ